MKLGGGLSYGLDKLLGIVLLIHMDSFAAALQVAVDFVSPESVPEVIKMRHRLRQADLATGQPLLVSPHDRDKTEKLQSGLILVRAAERALAVLEGRWEKKGSQGGGGQGRGGGGGKKPQQQQRRRVKKQEEEGGEAEGKGGGAGEGKKRRRGGGASGTEVRSN